MVMFHSYVSLPEGTPKALEEFNQDLGQETQWANNSKVSQWEPNEPKTWAKNFEQVRENTKLPSGKLT